MYENLYYPDPIELEDRVENIIESDLLEFDDEDVHVLLDSIDPKRIFLSSDWHLFKNHYKKEKNKVNTAEIIKWCKDNIKDTDLFIYLGDMCFRYANEEDKKATKEIFKSLPGIKILILGNHDVMAGDDFYIDCGFKYVFDQLIHHRIIFTHRPINVDPIPYVELNIHGHIHDLKLYNTTDGSSNINVYPTLYGGKPATLDYILKHQSKLMNGNEWRPNDSLGESYIEETKRSELPDGVFGIPEDRKFPLDTEQHVKSAIKLFGHAEPSKKKDLAKRIKAAAAKYSIKIPETTQVAKYLNESVEYLIGQNVNTIIFDMGKVLCTDDTKARLFDDINVPNSIIPKLYEYITGIICNEKLDKIGLEEFKEYLDENMPESIKVYKDSMIECIFKGLYFYDYSEDLIQQLKSKGYKLYYLSNWSRWSYELQEDKFANIISLFDGGMFSYESKYMKPDERFYKELIDKYNLIPDKCAFFDDKFENAAAAEQVGIKGLVFNNNYTPRMILEGSVDEIKQVSNILVDSDGELKPFNTDNIKWWYASTSKVSEVDSRDYFNTLEDAIANIMNRSEEPKLPEDNEDNDLYIYICNGTRQDIDDWNTPIAIGIVTVKPDRSFDWKIQYPISIKDGVYYPIGNTSEFSLASMNPIVGFRKPFLIKINNSDQTINKNQYLFSPDVVSDKYFAINEDSNISIMEASNFYNCEVEAIFEFVGDIRRANKILEAYNNKSIVDSTFLYTSLTGKPMLTNDQIYFDSNFKEFKLESMIYETESDLASMHAFFNDTDDKEFVPCIKDIDSLLYKVIKKDFDLELESSIDGYRIKSYALNRVSSVVESINDITDDMILGLIEHGGV